MSAPPVACNKHRHTPVKGYSPCAGCEVERLIKERDASLAELAALKGGREAVRYVCHACRADTPPPKPYRAFVSCEKCGEETAATRAACTAPPALASAWVPVSERLPEPGVTVMVYTPPQPGDYPDSVRISFDGICPESDGDYWVDHGEHYEHYCMIAKGGDADWHGPSEKAPYTHWHPLPAAPGAEVK